MSFLRFGCVRTCSKFSLIALIPCVLLAQYRATDLGTLGVAYTESAATGINSAGQVVGYSSSIQMLTSAFLWQEGTMTMLPPLPGYPSSRASAINDSGQVVGSSFGPGISRAVMWDHNVPIDLGRPGAAVAINNIGQIAINSEGHAFLWDHGKVTDLGALPGDTWPSARAINSRGQIVGNSFQRPFYWENGVMREVKVPNSMVMDINDKSELAGYDSTRGAWVWNYRRVTWIGKLNGELTTAFAINNAGQVVGASSYAFVWEKGRPTLLNLPAGWGLSNANDINDIGQIVGSAELNGHYHAVLWEK